jgi:shikimate kinase
MAAGKTTLGVALAERLEANFVDSDQVILELTGLNAAEIATARGVPELHRTERVVLKVALSQSSPQVIAAAASVVDDDATRDRMSRHLCIWVDADSATLAKRRVSGLHRRTISDEEVEDLNRARRLSVIDLVIGQVDTTASTVEQSTASAMTILSDHLHRFKDV